MTAFEFLAILASVFHLKCIRGLWFGTTKDFGFLYLTLTFFIYWFCIYPQFYQLFIEPELIGLFEIRCFFEGFK